MDDSAVYLLLHERTGEEGYRDVKLIGVYSVGGDAFDALEKAKRLPGFREQLGGFSLERYQLDSSDWRCGFGEGDVPVWAVGVAPRAGESPGGLASRLVAQELTGGDVRTGPLSEYGKVVRALSSNLPGRREQRGH